MTYGHVYQCGCGGVRFASGALLMATDDRVRCLVCDGPDYVDVRECPTPESLGPTMDDMREERRLELRRIDRPMRAMPIKDR